LFFFHLASFSSTLLIISFLSILFFCLTNIGIEGKGIEKFYFTDFDQAKRENIFLSPIWLKSDGQINSLLKKAEDLPNHQNKVS